MPTVSLFIAVSVDGFIGDGSGGVDWCFTDADYGYSEFFDSVDALVMGRLTFGKVLGLGDWPYEEKTTVVFGRGRPIDAPEHVRMTAEPPRAVLEQLAAEGKEHVWLVGGGGLASSFRREDLIDRYVLSVHPLLIGTGIPLFQDDLPGASLRLVSAQPFDSGLVQLTYERIR